jgi:hypothetical protein
MDAVSDFDMVNAKLEAVLDELSIATPESEKM